MTNIRKPLVSIIVPTFKRSSIIKNAIESVLRQTYKNIEIVVVDDNHPNSEERNNTKLNLQKYIDNNLITYCELDGNYGGAVARNKGLKLSNGEFVCFLDDDDTFQEKKVELQVNKFLESKETLAVVGGYANIVDENGKLIRIEKTDIKGDVYKRQLAHNICTTSIAMIRKQVAIDSGGFEKIPSSQEHLFFIKIFSVNPNYDYVKESVVNIFHHSGERISTNSKKPEGAIQLYNKVLELTSKMDDKEIKYIKHHHLVNITRSYISIGNSHNAMKYIILLLKNDRGIKLDTIKVFITLFIGVKNLYKIRTLFNNLKNTTTRGA
ncbi:glycosyltransferase family 2 protein [Halalkalibacter okhensis]|uniref:glycosyltransferase family 2 protein n=1 Tax=Halalkalibacter okhensis TaxID=333138 RepID=UPI0006923BA3|nr:glycosyltransferase family 2 protein [Halalkalibacter okhensis]